MMRPIFSRPTIFLFVACVLGLIPQAGFGQFCELSSEPFPFGGPSDFDNGFYQVAWCTNGATISGSQFCPTGSALKLGSSSQDPIVWVYVGGQGCSKVRIEFDYSQYSATGTLLKYATSSDTAINCSEYISLTAGALDVTGGVCTTVAHEVIVGGSQSVYWRFDHGTPSTNAIFIDNIRILLETCDCDGGSGGDHPCCEEGDAGCEDSAIESCVCAQDDYCCTTAWDAQCVGEVESFGCGSCGGSGCDQALDADFGSYFQSGSVCDLWPELFAACAGYGPYITSGTGCGYTGDYAMSFASGWPYSAATTHCLDLSTTAAAHLDFAYAKTNNTMGPEILISLDGSTFATLWTAPFAFPGGCQSACIDLADFVGEPQVFLSFTTGTSTSQAHSFDDIHLVLGSPCGGGEHTCCEVQPAGGCSDPTIQDCVCAIDPYCCDTQWDGQCVLAAEALGCTDCGGICLTGFEADFGENFVSGAICDLYPLVLLFETCEGNGPYLGSGTACGGSGDEALIFGTGSPISRTTTRCIDLTLATTAKLSFAYAKADGATGPAVEISTDDGASFAPLWDGPAAPGPGCHEACVSLTPYVGLIGVKLRFTAATESPSGLSFDDITLTLDDDCPACQAPAVDAGPGRTLLFPCTGATVQLSGTVSGGLGGSCPGTAELLWTGPGIVSGATTLTPTVDAIGLYTLTASCGDCEASDSVVVTQQTVLVADVNGDSVLDGRDVAAFVDVLIGDETDEMARCAADVDGDGTITTDDIDDLASAILGI